MEETIANIESATTEYSNLYELELESGRLKKKIVELKTLLSTYQSSHDIGPEVFEIIKDVIITDFEEK